MGFAFTTYVAILLLIIVPPLWLLLLVLPYGAWPGRALRWCARFVIRASGCGFEVRGVDRLVSAVPAMIVANHSSYLDSVVLMASLPIEYRFVANHGLGRIPFIRTAIRKAGYLLVNRGAMKDKAECVEEMGQVLREGTSVVVYPEGTTSRTAEMLPFHLGAFRVAVEAARPVVPITLSGTAGIWPRTSWMMRRGAIDVNIHEPIAIVAAGRDEILRVRDAARAAIAARPSRL